MVYKRYKSKLLVIRLLLLVMVMAIVAITFYVLPKDAVITADDVDHIAKSKKLSKTLKDVVRNEDYEVQLKDSTYIGNTVRDDKIVNYALRSGDLQKTEMGTYSLQQLQGEITPEDNPKLNIQSQEGVIDASSNLMQLTYKVNITTEDYSISSEHLNIDLAKVTFESPVPVEVKVHDSMIRSDSAVSSENAEQIYFKGNAHLQLDLSNRDKE